MKKFGNYLILLIIISIICISFILFSKNEKNDYDNKIDALSYKMDLKIDTKENILYEDVVINFKNNTTKSFYKFANGTILITMEKRKTNRI